MADGISTLERVIRQTEMRNKVLASNIANVDTPNYRAQDIKFGEALGNEMTLATTSPGHIKTAPAGSVSGQVSADDAQPWADKNNVEMDQEVAKLTENAMLFQAAVTLLEKKIQMYKSALSTSK